MFMDWNFPHISVLSKPMHRLMEFLSKSQQEVFFSVVIDKIILKCVWKRKGTRITKTVLKTKR